MTAPLTTASALVDFRQELIDGGFNEADAAHLASIALKDALLDTGLHVRDPEDEPTLTGVIRDLRARLEKLERRGQFSSGGTINPSTVSISGGLR